MSKLVWTSQVVVGDHEAPLSNARIVFRPLFKFCTAFTNCHIDKVPLRADDGEFEDKYLRKLRSDHVTAEQNRRAQQTQARRRRMMRISGPDVGNNKGNHDDDTSSSGSSVGVCMGMQSIGV